MFPESNHSTPWLPNADIKTLQARASMLAAIRAFFVQNQALEVDTPAISAAAASDPNIHSILATVNHTQQFLHTSPEFPMKRLLAAGVGDIYQITKVFRDGEVGRFHNPEFTLLEWYRLGFDHHQLMNEVWLLLQSLWPKDQVLPSLKKLSYHEAILMSTGFELEQLSVKQIQSILHDKGHSFPDNLGDDIDSWLDLLMSTVVAASFDPLGFTFIYDYPASQASLAKVREGEPSVAERFEVYFGELELANGFHELQDGGEQLSRFEDDVAVRVAQGKMVMPIDQRFIAALNHGLPQCSGVALGLDRLLMVLCDKHRIDEVLSFGYDNA